MPVDEWTIFHFSQSNPEGPGQGSVPALLRRVADSLEAMGPVDVQDVSFSSRVGRDGEDDLVVTVYYHRPD